MLQFQLKMKKKIKLITGVPWKGNFGKKYPRLLERALGKLSKCIFQFTKHLGYTERNRDYRGKRGSLCIYTYPIWDSCHFILLSPKFRLLPLLDAQKILTRSPIIIIFWKNILLAIPLKFKAVIKPTVFWDMEHSLLTHTFNMIHSVSNQAGWNMVLTLGKVETWDITTRFPVIQEPPRWVGKKAHTGKLMSTLVLLVH